MPERRTKRGAERTPLEGDFDVLICGASFAGLAVARELAGHRRARDDDRPLRDRRAPDLGLRHPDRVAARAGPRGLASARRSTSWWSTRRTARRAGRCPGRSRRSTTGALRAAGRPGRRTRSRPPRSTGGRATTVHTDRGDLTAPLVVDALGWRRVLGGSGFQPPDAPLSRGLEVHPWRRAATSWRSGSTARYVPAGYGWSFPARRGAARRRRARSTRAST